MWEFFLLYLRYLNSRDFCTHSGMRMACEREGQRLPLPTAVYEDDRKNASAAALLSLYAHQFAVKFFTGVDALAWLMPLFGPPTDVYRPLVVTSGVPGARAIICRFPYGIITDATYPWIRRITEDAPSHHSQSYDAMHSACPDYFPITTSNPHLV